MGPGAGVYRILTGRSSSIAGPHAILLLDGAIATLKRYPEIRIPVALMTGDSDSVVSPSIHSVQLAQTLPNARIDVLQGVGHLPHEASPERFEKLLEWVRAEMKRS